MTELLDEIELFEHPYNDPGFEPVQETMIFLVTLGRCWYCGKQLEMHDCDTDHVIPVSRGGTDETENLVPACKRCNGMKCARSLAEFRELWWTKFICEKFTPRQKYWMDRHFEVRNIKPPRWGIFHGEIAGLTLPLTQWCPRVKKPIDYALGRYGNLNPAP